MRKLAKLLNMVAIPTAILLMFFALVYPMTAQAGMSINKYQMVWAYELTEVITTEKTEGNHHQVGYWQKLLMNQSEYATRKGAKCFRPDADGKPELGFINKWCGVLELKGWELTAHYQGGK